MGEGHVFRRGWGRVLAVRPSAGALRWFAACALAASLAPVGDARAEPPKPAPPPKAPSAAQVAALADLEREAVAYERAARDYRSAITGIVQHHYEDRRRRVLAALDAELAVEKQGLRAAREEAIRRLEAFVAAHSGAAAHPESTPDAMFRLAALYEERARAEGDASDELGKGLLPAIALYKRVLREFPRYRERAGVHYYLGHAYNDAGRAAEAQQVWRGLVCANHFAYPTPADPVSPERDTVRPLRQDHDKEHWLGWRRQRPPPHGKDLTFETPYPEDCQPIAQGTPAGAEPRYLAEAWWLIGDHHFDDDPAGGPFALNRAEAAYRRSLRFTKPPVHGVAMYKLAWTYFREQRYEASVRAFVDLLRYADEQEKRTGEIGADFRGEAFTYIAGALVFVDFTGPDGDAPFSPRADVLDTETDARVAERKMRVAVDRVQDPQLIPQNERWTVSVYRALARELADLNQLHSKIEVLELVQRRWPLHRDAPLVQEEIASAYDRLAAGERDGTPLRAETEARALDARSKLALYVGATEWVQKNLGDPEAILAASHLASTGLRRAAADHTNAGSALAQRADGTADGASELGVRKRAILERALAEYRLAARAWSAGPAQEEGAAGYEARFWEADARNRVVALTVQLGKSPAADEIDVARRAAIAVRDSNEDDKHLQSAAFMLVDVARQVLRERHAAFRASAGKEGIEPREAVRTTGQGAAERVVAEPLPKEVAYLIAALDEYVARVPAARDVGGDAQLFRYQAAESAFLYGQLDEARRRLAPLYEADCGRSTYAFKAWVKLLTIANLQHDVERAGALASAAQAKSCATDAGEAELERAMARGTHDAIGYETAGHAFEVASKMTEGPARVAKWREAGALYRAALERAPGAEAAPEAAINGALAWKQVGDYDQAIVLYELLVREYGSEANLARLERGDASVTPPVAPRPSDYATRVGYLERAYSALSAAYVLFFDYRRAAATYDAVAKNARFAAGTRREAARNAAVLHATMGDRERVRDARATMASLGPSAVQRAEVDYQAAATELHAWDERGVDEGANKAARLAATSALEAFHKAYEHEPAAQAYALRAAHAVANLRRAGREARAGEWCKKAVAAFAGLRAEAPVVEGRNTALGSPEADLAAECAYRALDDAIRADLGRDEGRPHAGTIDKVTKAYDDDLARAERHAVRLEEVVTAFGSRSWSAAARARQASLYDAARTRLYWSREPGIVLFTDREKRLLDLLSNSANPELAARADELRQKRREDWRAARERLLERADRPMLKGYAEAVLWSRAWAVKHEAVDRATQRLALFTRVVGDERIRAATVGLVDPATRGPFAYTDGTFLRSRPGKDLAPADEGRGLPLPAQP
jgi:hypothetical protein